MDDFSTTLDERLVQLRNRAVHFFDEAQREINARFADVHPFNIWTYLSKDLRRIGGGVRGDLRVLMSEIAKEATHSVLIDDADIRDLSQNTKRMSASLRIRSYTSWSMQIHHNEGDYIGSEPPGQEENDTSIESAKREFLRSYTATTELLDLLSAKKQNVGSHPSDPKTTPLISYRPATAFIMMWIDPSQPDLGDVLDVVKEVFKEFGVVAVRADDLQHADGITERIIDEIRQSEFLFADLTGERPSVYYEIGYAHALRKSVMLFRRAGTKIHFDLAYRNCPEYDSIGDLRTKLRNRMRTLTNKNAINDEKLSGRVARP